MGCSTSTPVEEITDFHTKYKLGKKLGEGAFGQVRIARSKSKNDEVAVKIVDVRARTPSGEVSKHADPERVQMARNEIKLWSAVTNSDYCVRLHSTHFDKNLFYMVMERCSCSLMDRLARSTDFVEWDLCRIFSGMLSGIKHVHTLRIVHRDIKPDNFLFGGKDKDVVKLCDFGLAGSLPKKGRLKGVFGTAPYMSPEMLDQSGYDTKTDVWSFGVTVFLMIHGDYPYTPKTPSADLMKKCILNNKPEIKFNRPESEMGNFSKSFLDRATEFLQAVLQRSQSSRKHAEDVMNLPFLTEAGKDEVIDTPKEQKKASFQPGPPEVVEPETFFAPVFRKARKATLDEHAGRKLAPVKQTALEDLLKVLQERPYFSEGDEKNEDDRPAALEERIVARRSNTRFSTHSGIVTDNLKIETLSLDQGSLNTDRLKAEACILRNIANNREVKGDAPLISQIPEFPEGTEDALENSENPADPVAEAEKNAPETTA